MSHAEPSAHPRKLRDPLRYWLDQEIDTAAAPVAAPARLASGWWILPLVGSGAFSWLLLFWLLFD